MRLWGEYRPSLSGGFWRDAAPIAVTLGSLLWAVIILAAWRFL